MTSSPWDIWIKENGLIKVEAEVHSDKWFAFREGGLPDLPGGIGASECGKICGQDEYDPCIGEVYEVKIGKAHYKRFDNERMFSGRVLEPLVYDYWRFWDGTKESYISKYEKWLRDGRPSDQYVRPSTLAKYYVINPEYPWLFMSLDAVGLPSFKLDGEVIKTPFPIEIKNIESQASKQWIGGLPRKYIYQINQQMLIMGVDYGEIAMLTDGRYFEVFPFYRDENICNEIIKKTKIFWEKRVIPGRKLWQGYNAALSVGNKQKQEESLTWIDKLCPPPDGTKAYYQWMREKAVNAREESLEKVIADPDTYIKARYYEGLKEVLKLVQKEQNIYKSYLMKELQKSKYLDYNEGGYTSLKSDGSINNRIKDDLKPQALQVIKDMNIKRMEEIL